ncbi:MAG: ATP synthase F0 subunit A [Bacteroidetes bacterium]|nr:MAG: ATP synthase F0 subunit A [Bacteroidota bacterium]
MQSKFLVKFLTLILLVFSFNANAQHEGTSKQADIKSKIKEDIQHHIQDSHDFTFYSNSKTGKHTGFPLPVILWDNGLQVFMSSKLHHGETVAESNGNYYKLYHNKIYKTDVAGTIEYDEHNHPDNIKPLDFSITKNVFMIIVTGLLMLWLFGGMAKSFKEGPIAKGIAGRLLEPIIIYIRDDIAIPNIGEKKYKKYLPFLLTVFFFVLFLNLLGLAPLGINVTGNITITFALSILVFFITQFSGNKNYWMHIFWMPGVPWPMKIILAPIELLGVLIKPFALMIRLYANIMAGHIVLMSLVGLIFVFQNWIGSGLSFMLSFAISMIELLVAFLQAYIFTMLSALYFGFAVEEHEHEEAH